VPHAGPGGCTIEHEQPRLLVQGEIDVASVELLAEHVSRAVAQGVDLEIDLSNLRFIDIAGLGVLYDAARKLGKEGRTLTLVSPPPSVPRMLDLLGWNGMAGFRVQLPE
jgi:anti-anti-sigma factor